MPRKNPPPIVKTSVGVSTPQEVSIPQEVNIPGTLVHPPDLPLRPYLDDIWDVLDGLNGTVGGIGDDITDIQNDVSNIQDDILDLQTTCCGGGSRNIDGGTPTSVYLPSQVVDGGVITP